MVARLPSPLELRLVCARHEGRAGLAVSTASRPWLHCGNKRKLWVNGSTESSPRPHGRGSIAGTSAHGSRSSRTRLHGLTAVAPLRAPTLAQRERRSTGLHGLTAVAPLRDHRRLRVRAGRVQSPRPHGRGSIAGSRSWARPSPPRRRLHGLTAVAPLRAADDDGVLVGAGASPRPHGRGSIAGSSRLTSHGARSGRLHGLTSVAPLRVFPGWWGRRYRRWSPRPHGRGSIAGTRPRTRRRSRHTVSTASRPWLHCGPSQWNGQDTLGNASPRPHGRGSIAGFGRPSAPRAVLRSPRPHGRGSIAGGQPRNGTPALPPRLHGLTAVAPLRG